MTRNKHLPKVVAAAAVAVALILTACGSSEDSSPATPDAGGSDVTTESEGTPVAVAVGEIDVNTQYMNVDPGTVPAGTDTFTVTNEGTKEHEFEILATDTPAGQFEVGEDDKIVDPEDAADIEELEGIEGGDTVTVTVDLEPGHYVLVCNEVGHYRMGMYTDFTVE